jgi:hypothetical protein
VAKTLGYLITWTTYGTWLQGDERGYVKNAKIYPGNKSLMKINKQSQLQDVVLLSKSQQQIVREALTEEAKLLGQHIYAMVVQSNHIHLVCDYINKPIGGIVAH